MAPSVLCELMMQVSAIERNKITENMFLGISIKMNFSENYIIRLMNDI